MYRTGSRLLALGRWWVRWLALIAASGAGSLTLGHVGDIHCVALELPQKVDDPQR